MPRRNRAGCTTVLARGRLLFKKYENGQAGFEPAQVIVPYKAC